MIVGGIDPGKSGAIVVLDGKRIVHSSKTPVISVGKGSKREYDPNEMMNVLSSFDFDLVIIEKLRSEFDSAVKAHKEEISKISDDAIKNLDEIKSSHSSSVLKERATGAARRGG